MTSTPTDLPRVPTDRRSRLRQWSGRTGAVALAGLGTAHLVINSIGFARAGGGSWPLFLTFAVGLSAVLLVLAVMAWREATRGTGRLLPRVLIGLAGSFCLVGVVNVLRGLHPELIISPIGPGLWSLVGGPALVLTALLPARLRSTRG